MYWFYLMDAWLSTCYFLMFLVVLLVLSTCGSFLFFFFLMRSMWKLSWCMPVLVHCLVLMALFLFFLGSSTKLTFSLWATQNDLMYWFCMVCFTETFNLSHKKKKKKNILLWACNCIALAHGLLTLPKISLWDFQYEPCNLHAFWFNLIYIF